MKWTNEKVLKVLKQAQQRGREKAQEKLAELVQRGPVFAVVENSPKDGIFYDPTKPTRTIDTMLDVCGFANNRIKAKGSFYLIAKRLAGERAYDGNGIRFMCGRGYYGGGSLSIFDMTFRQEMSVNEAAADGVAEVLNSWGIEASTESRID